MEQNKVLMVIVSVAIFFAAIIGVGVALLYPRGDDMANASSGSVTREFDPIEYVRNPDDAPLNQQQADDEPMVIVYGDNETDTGTSGDTESAPAESDGTGAAEVVVPGDEQSNQVTITERPARQPRETAPAAGTTTTAAPQQPAASAPAEPSADTAPSATTSTPEPTPQPRQIRVTEYWIQLIASPNRDRVEQARTVLADYSLGGRVTTRDIDGELYYRLRVGPYESHDEAAKFLEWIQDIEGFGDAYISEEYPLRTVRS